MAEFLVDTLAADSAVCSSLSADVWHARSGFKAYEWWYFDALSDDGREAVVITFFDNYVFSPRYAVQSDPDDSKVAPIRFPAVAFSYSVDGKTVFRTISEFSYGHFAASRTVVECSIGDSSFHVDSASYGSGYLVTVDVPLGPAKRLKASFEWLTVEGDLLAPASGKTTGSVWNMVASRSDVSGRIEMLDRKGKSKRIIHFRGTGYHDHRSGDLPLYETIGCRQWGRAHFTDCTAVFCVETDEEDVENRAKLLITRNGKIDIWPAKVERQKFHRDKFGIKYPQRLIFSTEENIRLRIKPVETIESTFCELRFLSEMTLMLGDGKPRKTVGISEILAPKNIRNRLFHWFSDLQIGKDGNRPAF